MCSTVASATAQLWRYGIETVARAGDAASELAEAAPQRQAHLLVLGSRGQGERDERAVPARRVLIASGPDAPAAAAAGLRAETRSLGEPAPGRASR